MTSYVRTRQTHIAERKLYQLKIANQTGLTIPRSIITNKRSLAINFLESTATSIIKPISNGLQVLKDKTYSIYTTEISHRAFIDLQLAEIFSTPVFLQERIINKADIMVTIIGDVVFAQRLAKMAMKWIGENLIFRKYISVSTYPVRCKPCC